MTDSAHPPLPADARLTLTTLGGAALGISHSQGSGPHSQAFDAGKPLALVAYLAFSPGHAASREHLLDLLWADLEPDAAKHALRQTLWYIRRKLGDGVLVAAGDRITLGLPVDSDRDAFLDAVDRGDLEGAVARYAGDFLPAFAAPGGAEFEKWADVERARLRALFIRCAESLARRWMGSARARDAQPLARRIRDLDRLNQGAWRLLLETLLAARDTLAASAEADALERLLAEEEIEPEQSTRAAIRNARAALAEPAPVDGAPRPGLVAELVGREREFSTILAHWEAARVSRGAHLHLVGGAGLGKSRLLADVHARLRASRARVVLVRATLATRDIPYALAGDLAAALAALPGARGVSPNAAAVLVALNPTLSSIYSAAPEASDAGEALRRRSIAVRELIDAVSEDHPLAILIDDAHWSDPLSLLLLRGALHGIERARALVVTAARPSSDVPQWGETTARIELGPLGVDDIAALVASLAALPHDDWAERLPAALTRASDGSPLLALETLQLLLDQRILARTDLGWTTPDPGALFATLHAGSTLRARVSSLRREEQWVLLLIAVAGGPLGGALLIRAAGRDTLALDATCHALEQRGMIARLSEAWVASHDEIARTSIDTAAPDALAAAESAVGLALAREPHDWRALRRAVPHLARGGREAEIDAIFARFIRKMRQDGDQRSHAAFARELLGSAATEERVAALVASLPWLVRVGLSTPRRVAAAAAVLALLPATVMLARAMVPAPARLPDAVLVAVRRAPDSTGAVYATDIESASWAQSGAVTIDVGAKPRWRVARTRDEGDLSPDVRPTGEGWVVDRTVADSGVIDLFDVGVDGSERRLTFARGDDNASASSPDGSRIVFSTARWNALSHYDIAVYDRRAARVAPITRGDDYDVNPRWSLDGSAIAFVRRHYYDAASHVTELCVASPDASRLSCRAPSKPGTALAAIGGWTATGDLVTVIQRGDVAELARLRPFDGEPQPLGWIFEREMRVSPDGHWVLCACRRAEDRRAEWVVFPVDRPSDFHTVVLRGDDTAGVRLAWGPARPVRRYIDRLEIVAGAGAPALGQAYRLRTRSVDPAGLPVTPAWVTWRSLDTTVATIDSTGVLHPRRMGGVTIEASAGGWRVERLQLTVHEAAARTLFVEDWSHGIEPRWRPFGDPRPRTVDDARLGHAFLNNGDGSFSSGAYLATRLPIGDGVGVDAELSTTFERAQWRAIGISFEDLDDDQLRTWNHLTGDAHNRSATCGVGVPAGEGYESNDSLAVHGVGQTRSFVLPPALRTGRPFHVRVQIFPDGRCGVALDGLPLWIAPTPFGAPSAYLRLAGATRYGRMLVGRVEVYAGVRAGVAWEAVH